MLLVPICPNDPRNRPTPEAAKGNREQPCPSPPHVFYPFLSPGVPRRPQAQLVSILRFLSLPCHHPFGKQRSNRFWDAGDGGGAS